MSKRNNKPNILLIVVDSLRSDHLSCYGYERETTPFIDDISDESIVFENAISPSGWTRATFSSIFSGTYPSKNGWGLHPGKFMTMMEILRAYGYKTFGITGNYYLKSLSRKFDNFSFMTRRLITKMFSRREILGLLSFIIKHKSVLNIERLGGFLKTKIAKKWLDQNYAGDPFFMFLHYTVHWPYDPPEPFFSSFLGEISRKEVKGVRRDVYDLIAEGISDREIEVLRSLYDGEVNYIDSCLGQLIEHLKSLDIFDNTLLVITSDHGDLLGEHGLLHHHFALYEPLIKVPLILKFPDLFMKGKRYSGLVQTMDILPTLIDYLDIKWMDISREMQGESLLKLMKKKEGREFTISERSDWSPSTKEKMVSLKKRHPDFDWDKYVHEIIALRTKEYKYIWSSEGKHELYDLRQDPSESNNIVTIENEKASELKNRLEKWKRSFLRISEWEEGKRTSFEKEKVKEKLRRLGYL